MPSHESSIVVVAKIVKGRRPAKPQGAEGMWFTDDVRGILEWCWRPIPGDRPGIRDVLQCLETVSRTWTSPSPQTLVGLPTTDSPTHNLGSSGEESTDGSEVFPSSQVGSSQQSRKPPPTGDPNVNSVWPPAHEFLDLLYGVSGYQDPGKNTKNTNGWVSEEPAEILDRVSWTGLIYGFWY